MYDEVNSRFRNFGNALESRWYIYIDQFGTGCDTHNCDSAGILSYSFVRQIELHFHLTAFFPQFFVTFWSPVGFTLRLESNI